MRLEAESATWPEAERARHRSPAVLPFGALEQHGPHLPLSTDTVIAAWLAQRVADAVDGWLLPAVPFGDTAGNDGFPGTLSLSFDTVRAVLIDVGRALRRSGFPCLIVVNGDYGNRAPLRLASRDLAAEAFSVLVVDYPGLEEVAAEVCESPPAGPGFYHADELETSVLLALRPSLVHRERAVAAYPELPVTLGAVPADLARLSPSGVLGDPTRASAEKGAAILEGLQSRAVEVARAFLIETGASPTVNTL